MYRDMGMTYWLEQAQAEMKNLESRGPASSPKMTSG
jgi:hypothetical protein